MIAGSVFFGLVLTDQYILRFRYDTSGPADFLVTHLNWWRTFVKNNSLGYWEREIRADESSPLMISVTGNSFTWGQGVKGMQYRFTAVLQNVLREHGLEATVLNYTRGPAETAIDATMESMRKVHPDVVLLCRTLIDIPVVEYVDGGKMRVNDDPTKLSMQSSWQNLTFFNPTLNFVTWKLLAAQRYQLFALAYFVNATLAYSDAETLARNTDSIKQTADKVRAIGAQPVYVLLPYPHLWYYFMPSVRERAVTNIRNSLADAGIPLVDLTPIENEVSLKEFEIDPADAHPNERMHNLIGHRLYDGLIPVLAKMHLPKR
jgi:lysophospholipase L1-like esterase